MGLAMVKVRKKNLLAIAGAVWMLAGINIAVIGLQAYAQLEGMAIVFCILGSIVVASAFHVMFGKLSRKNALRIEAMPEDEVSVFRMFNARGYLVMVFMISLGITLRVSGIVPGWFIAFFYTGLGLSLAAAGLGFFGFRANGATWNPHNLSSIEG